MDKINVVLVLLKRETLEENLEKLNFSKVELVAIVSDSNEEFFHVGDKQIPRTPFATFPKSVKKFKNFFWLISGYVNNFNDISKMKNFLMANGVPERNIVNFEVLSQVSSTWLANLRYVEEQGADFFATGNGYTRNGLDLNYIPCVQADKNSARGGVNLADANQDLRRAYLTASHIFAHVAPGTIKFVLIGLVPTSFHYDTSKDFFGFQHLLTFANINSKEALPNFENLQKKLSRKFTAKAIANWTDETKNLTSDSVGANVQILKYYIELCLANGAKPIGVVFPFTTAAKKTYDEEILEGFRKTINQLKESYDFTCIDMFNQDLNYDCFYDMTHLNARGAAFMSTLLSLELYLRNLIPVENFCDMTYDYFDRMSRIVPKDDYNNLMSNVFEASVAMIRRKEKVKLGFVLYDSSMWSGDDLYNLFVQDERFEVTVFLCQRTEALTNEMIHNVFLRDINLLKSHGLNLVSSENLDTPVPAQDVLIFLTPYFERVMSAFRPENLPVKTLMAHIIYSFAVSVRSKKYYNRAMFRTVWKIFFPSTVNLKMYGKRTAVGMPRGLYSGYPRIDIFFKKDTEFQFEWKMARPDAKKIIWAPHHSINEVTKWATFQWNYQFMYEFAKAHPEISWVVKPHPNLAYRAIANKVFPNVEAFEEYMQKWNDLPNAQVYTGAYYQAIFATSDGMIHDSGSFTAEYQYVDKPMIYLTREGTVFNELGNEIFKGSYLVDGKNFDAIAATIQKVFIEGNDDKAALRKEVFDRYLNYPKANGMLASEFIYKSIADKLRGL